MTGRIVFTGVGVFLALTALPGIHWHDTAEFAAVGRWLSVSHAPGHPLHAVGTHGAQLIPIGDAAFRANLFSVVCLAGALALLDWVIRRMAPELPAWGRACAAALPAVLPAIWLQGVRAEVYALQLLLSVGIAASLVLVHAGDRRGVLALGLTFGLAGANHSFIGLMLVPAALVVLFVARPGWRAIFTAAPAALLGLAAYAYLPLRARVGGVVGWGQPDSLAGFWEMLSARDWTRARESGGPESLLDNAQRMAAWFIDHFGVVTALLLFLVFTAGVLVGRERRGALAVLGLGALGFVSNRVLVAFDPHNPDLGGYLAGALVACVIMAAVCAAALRPWVALVFPVGLGLGALDFDPGQRMGARAADLYAVALQEEAPPDGVIVYSDYASVFSGWGARAIYGTRPDVALLFRGRLSADGWHLARLARSHPIWAARARGFPQGFDSPAARFEPGVRGEMLGDLRRRLGPAGMLTGVDAMETPESLTAAFRPLDGARDFDSRRHAAFAHAQHAELYVDTGRRALAAWHLGRAIALAGRDPLLTRLEQRLTAPD